MKLIALGCGSAVHPSGSIAYAGEALAQGADVVEVDVQLTADKKLAVFHDTSLKNCFGVDKSCGELSSGEFLALRHTDNPMYPTHLLDHFFQCGIAPILIRYPMSVSAAVLDLVEEYGYADRVILGVDGVRAVRQAKDRFPETEVLGFIPDPALTPDFTAAGASCICLWESWLTEENIRRVQESGAKLWVMCGSSENGYPAGKPGVEDLCRILALEPDGILTGDIPWAKAVMAEF